MSARPRWPLGTLPAVAGLALLVPVGGPGAAQAPPPDAAAEYSSAVRPLVQKYCLGCHSAKLHKGSLDLERFASAADVRKDLKVWQQTIELLDADEMPPKDKPQPTAAERKALTASARGVLDAEATARAGDPGAVPLRRLSNAEYDLTIRGLTGVDLRPTREFPADGAGGEGFTNAAEALSDISPALFTKYLAAAKDVADHAVLLPDGFRFSPAKTRRDWTNEAVAQLRAFYADYPADGKLPLQPYLSAAVRHRAALAAGTTTPDAVAAAEKLNPKYLGVLWRTLTDPAPSYPLDAIRGRWKTATEKDVPALTAEVAAWQAAVWKTTPIGSYRALTRQGANDPAAVESQRLKVSVKPAPGQTDVTLYLAARDLTPGGRGGRVVWHRPRLEGGGKPPLLLRDYPQFGPAYEVDFPAVFRDAAKYLGAAAELAHDPKQSAEAVAKAQGLDPAFLARWTAVVAVGPRPAGAADPAAVGRAIPTAPLELLDERSPKGGADGAVGGWRKKGTDVPSVVANASAAVLQIPGTLPPHAVAVHPSPAEFAGVVWASPVAGVVRVAARLASAHPVCGNGVGWRLEHRRAGRAVVLADGAFGVGGSAAVPARDYNVEAGDEFVLAVDARNGDHGCDLTEVGLTATEVGPGGKPGRAWDLAADVAITAGDANPHPDRQGNRAVWRFVRGPSFPAGPASGLVIPPTSALGRWREAAADPARRADAAALAGKVQLLLAGPRPAKDGDPDRVVYDRLVSVESPLFNGLDPARLAPPRAGGTKYGLPAGRFAGGDGVTVPADSVTEVRLPAALFRDREFVVDGQLDGPAGGRVVQVRALTAPPAAGAAWDGKGPVVAAPGGPGYAALRQGFAAFRDCFPVFICFPQVIPTDEVVCLKMFHREDEPLIRLFLDDARTQRLDHLWAEHQFVSRQAAAENAYLPQFIGFVTQDQTKELLAYFEGQRPVFQERATAAEAAAEAAGPGQLDQLLDFAARAYRRPLAGPARADLLILYRALRAKGVPHDEAVRGVLARVLVSPAFLFRVEQAPPGKDAGPIDDWELAARLSYFLWSAGPDDDLRRLAAAGRLRDPGVLADQARRMLADDRVRALAVEFGTQWVHVRGFEELREKNESLFPAFDSKLRAAMSEEAVLFFQDLFRADRPVTAVLDADYTYLNDALANFYGIPGVAGPQWRRVEGVRKYGRGGVLGLAAVQARQSGASRTSPVLRGNWVVETLLGEKLPRPPAGVPQLPEEEGGAAKLTVRQMVEKHAKVAECAVCHRRIDPFGFALEKYDAIGRLRDKDFGGLPVDVHAKLKDGTEFDGLDGLRDYLLTKKKDVVVRLFCRRLLGYALGRAVTLSDQALVDEMAAALTKPAGKLSAAVALIVRSPQFRTVRGRDYPAD